VKIPRPVIVSTKGFLRRRGILVDRYHSGTSAALRVATMMQANGVDLVLDVGANDGGYARSMRDAGFEGRILSFEPLQAPHDLLVAAATHDDRWEIAPRMALGATDGQAEINVAGNSVSSSILEMLEQHRAAAPESVYIGQETTPLCRLDSVRHPFIDSSRSSFLKIDTQGYEEHVLKGASAVLGKIRGIQIELSLHPLYEGQLLWKELISQIEATGFELWSIVPGFFDPSTGRMLQCDGIFFRTGRALLG